MEPLVTAEWLSGQLGLPDVRVVDATYHANFPGEPPRNARAEYRAGHIPGAVFLDLETLVDTATTLPNMLPSLERVAGRRQRLGLSDDTRLILYDGSPHHTSARAWWVLRQHGVTDVALLDGGLAAWRAANQPIATGEETAGECPITAMPPLDERRTLAQMIANLASGLEQVVDARSPARFTGTEADPRPNTAAGHIPGSLNLPYRAMFDTAGRWKRGNALAAAFTDAGVDLDRPIVTTCGSGVTAAVLSFGLHLLGRDAALYDGSWSEWGADPATLKATGPA